LLVEASSLSSSLWLYEVSGELSTEAIEALSEPQPIKNKGRIRIAISVSGKVMQPILERL
jgi:hypothetical protein